MMERTTGLRAATTEQRGRAARYIGMGSRLLTYPAQQSIERIINQGALPACVGCAMCAGAEALFKTPPRLSWVRLWTDARRRDGTLTDNTVGTWFTSAIESAMQRGFDPEEPEEWAKHVEQTEPDDLDSEMAAYDTRQRAALHWRIPDGELDAVDEAIVRGLCIGIGTGVRTPYLEFFARARSEDSTDVLLTTDALGGYSNGHEQRIVAVEKVDGARQYLLQNSWGHAGGAHLPNGDFQLGLARVDESVLRQAWDIDVIALTRR